MKALVEHISNEKEMVTVKGSIREFLNKQYEDNLTFAIDFYKEKFGSIVDVASVYFGEPYKVVLRYQYLTETEQKQFIGFVADHVTTSIYGKPFSIEMRS